MEVLDFILGLLKGLLIFGIILLIFWIVIAIVLYILTSYVMEKHSKIKYGKGSVLVWIPIARLYYLGKALGGEYLGIGLILLRVLFMVDGIGGTKILFFTAGTVYKLVLYGMFIYLYTKCKELEKTEIKEAKIKKEK